MGLIEELFGDDSILDTPIDSFVLDDNNNCEDRLVPNVPPREDRDSWNRFGSMQNASKEALAVTLLEMENIKNNGGDLNDCDFLTGPPLKWALNDKANTPAVVEFHEWKSRFTKKADLPFSSDDSALRGEIFDFLEGHGHQVIIGQLNLQSEEFIRYLIDSVRNKLESNDTEEDEFEHIVRMSVLDFSTDLGYDDRFLVTYSIYIFCRLRHGEDDDPNDELIKDIQLQTIISTIKADDDDWVAWMVDNEEDAERAEQLRDKFITQYGPEGFYDT